MKVYIGNVTLDTNRKLTKPQIEKFIQYLSPYKEFKITIYDCVVVIEGKTFDVCHEGFDLDTFLHNLYLNSDTLVKLIRKYIALNELSTIDFYSLENFTKEMEEFFFNVTPIDYTKFSSSEKCPCVSVTSGSLFVESANPIGVKRYSYGNLVLYVPENIPGAYSCFVKKVGEALERAGIWINANYNKLVVEIEGIGKGVILEMPHREMIPLCYLFSFLYKLSTNESFREKFVSIAKKVIEAKEKQRSLEISLSEVQSKITRILYKSAGIELPFGE